jgi:hypothetical protein
LKFNCFLIVLENIINSIDFENKGFICGQLIDRLNELTKFISNNWPTNRLKLCESQEYKAFYTLYPKVFNNFSNDEYKEYSDMVLEYIKNY